MHLWFLKHCKSVQHMFTRQIAIYADMIYTASCIMFWMCAYSLRGQVGGDWALEFESFLGPVKWHRADRRVPFGALYSWFITLRAQPWKKTTSSSLELSWPASLIIHAASSLFWPALSAKIIFIHVTEKVEFQDIKVIQLTSTLII